MKYEATPISEIIDEIAMGPFGSNIKVECFVESGIPVLNGSNVDGIKLCEDSFRYITKEKADTLGRANASRGDIVITHRGTLGQIAYIPLSSQFDRYVISQSQFRMKCNSKAIPEYVVYYFHSREGRHQILSNKSQVGVPALGRPTSTFQNLTIPLPTIKQQMKIVATLSCLDDKIELNNKINANLEAQAQAIFKSWFVDFEPFQNGDFVDSELGRIPKGWQVGKLSDIAEITMGQSPKGDSYNENGEGIVFYQGRGEFSNRFPVTRLYTTEPKRMAKKNDILMSVRAPVGDVNIAKEDCCIGRGLAAIRSNSNHSSFLLYLVFNMKAKLDTYNGEGTVFGSINKKDLHGMKIVIPQTETINEYENIVQSVDKKIFILCQQNQVLAALRDALLPKLMSREIEVPISDEETNENHD